MEIIEVRTFLPPEGSGVIGHIREVRLHVPDEAAAVAASLSGAEVRVYRTVEYFGDLWD